MNERHDTIVRNYYLSSPNVIQLVGENTRVKNSGCQKFNTDEVDKQNYFLHTPINKHFSKENMGKFTHDEFNIFNFPRQHFLNLYSEYIL